MRAPLIYRTGMIWRRIVATGGALLIFALTVCASSPAAHAWVHQGEEQHRGADSPSSVPSDSPDSCAIVLFAAAADIPVHQAGLPTVDFRALTVLPSATDELDLISPRFLRQPERGPPAS